VSFSPRYELGPIRPPSEASSLLIRVTRGCAWNRCAFCPVYKGIPFSLREVEEVKADVFAAAQLHGDVFTGAFLQDADSLLMPSGGLAEVIRLIKTSFPRIRRVTTYSRSATIAKLPAGALARLRDAGLTRVHVGLESGSMAVLRLVTKGVSPRVHIEAGRRVKEARLSLSEYVMPGLGGRALTRENALETARVLNAIDPDTIRIRTLHIPSGTPLDRSRLEGEFLPLTEDEIVRELRMLIEALDGISSEIVSDHSLNLLMEVRGKLPEDKSGLLGLMDRYLSMPDRDRSLFRLGRRLGVIRQMSDFENDALLRAQLEGILEKLEKGGPAGLEELLADLLGRMI
jgi:radical SAM superfamily enzyme YgiQ (UPF0313 family)